MYTALSSDPDTIHCTWRESEGEREREREGGGGELQLSLPMVLQYKPFLQ